MFARLRVQAQRKSAPLRPPAWVRWMGWGIVGALFLGVVAAARIVHPW
ncbi:MAG: hypothetical protein R2878_07335 [Thermoleophilia bacterium]